ncbi:hypothetical protein COB55_02555 [Candidatus Wolfebacteria bacterium]|nr:MAG: hypothetical protein COB55_02555 [Candidatus Wolfebacteria bacterium]
MLLVPILLTIAYILYLAFRGHLSILKIPNTFAAKCVATRRLHEAQLAILTWKRQNPYTPDYNPEYQRLVQICIGAHMLWQSAWHDSFYIYRHGEQIEMEMERLLDQII